MTIVFYFLIALYLPSVATNAGLFDLAEYRRVSYDASIGENFLWFVPDLDLRDVTPNNIDDFEKRIVANIPDESVSNYLFVTSKGGQKFACSLPDVEVLKKPRASRSSKNPKIYGDSLAASFYVDKCIKLRGNHWWGYILCRGQTVEQVHGEPGQEGYVRNILGLFDGSLTMPSYQESTEDRLLYVEESYSSGTFCDLETYREPRSTTVRYECDPQLSTNEAYVSSVAEVKPCQYRMIVKVGTLCHYPEFLPTSQANTKNIGCQPYLSQTEVREMLERQLDEKRRKSEAKRQIALAKEEFDSALRIYSAMTKSARTMNNQDEIKKTNAEMDYNAAHFNLLIAKLEEEGEPLPRSKLDSMWKLFTTTDTGDYMFYIDHDSIADENRANLWYYFNDPTWPKDYFPKDISYVAVQNAYIDEVTINLQSSYDYDYDRRGVVEGVTEFLKTGIVQLETNAVIPAMAVYDEITELSVDFVDDRYTWLQALHLVFLDERDEFIVVDRLLDKIMYTPKYIKYFPMGQMAQAAIPLVLNDVWADLQELSRNGLNSKLFDINSQKHKAVYTGLDIQPYPTDQQKKKRNKNVNYVLKVVEEKTGYYAEMEYLHLLAPLYQMLSISWFQRKNREYFHVSPVSGAHLKDKDSEDYRFHKNLARDMAYFGEVLTYLTMTRMGEFEDWQNGKDVKLVTAEQLENYLMQNPFEINDDLIELAESVLFEKIGPEIVKAAKTRLWAQKMARYKTNHWIKDRKLRKQAQSMQGLMKDLLSVKDDSSAFVSLGGKTGTKKKEIIDEKMLSKLSMLDSVDDMDVEALKDFKDRLTMTTPDDDFYEFDEMQNVLDLLEKAGLSKKTEIQIKMFDENGNEVKSEELDAITKNILDSAESSNRFKEMEKAYRKKHLKDEEAEEE